MKPPACENLKTPCLLGGTASHADSFIQSVVASAHALPIATLIPMRGTMRRQLLRALCVLLLLLICIDAFSPPSSGRTHPLSTSRSFDHRADQCVIGRYPSLPPTSGTSTALSMANNFDLSRPTFDMFTLRTIRGDALLQYNTLNQSEPLRINLYLLLTFTLLALPSMSEAVLGEDLSLPGTAASVLGSIGSFALFFRECGRRGKQLERIEKEMNAEFLPVRLPNNRFAERPYGPAVQLTQLRGKKRIIALCGNKDQIKTALTEVRVFRNRLFQAAAIVIPVPTDGSSVSDWGISKEEIASSQFLGKADNVQAWVQYFNELSQDDQGDEKLVWFGLNNNGRSFASGAGDSPRLVEVLGQNLRPVEILLEADEAVKMIPEDDAVLSAQKKFYSALTTGDREGMASVFTKDQATEVSEVIGSGGRIDNWDACLEDGARPEDMQISGSDALIVSPEVAYSTAVEFPSNTGVDSATLLAVQRWQKEGDEWKLYLHQTIPWSPDSKAGGTLLCSCNGCVALTRAKDKRTFGGIVG